jgi:hypothetical protein
MLRITRVYAFAVEISCHLTERQGFSEQKFADEIQV